MLYSRAACLARRQRAFTLIELLVVIVILGILMAVAVPTFLRQQAKAQDSRTKQYLTTAYKAIRASTPETNNQYPSSTSMVSWVQQSEPELTAERGSCANQVQTAVQDAVLVDPSSTSTALTICARSASGNVWKLTASNTGVQQLLDGTLVPLTMSGNEITDSTRTSDVQGDGLSSDSSTGIWESTTNLMPSGGFETNTTGWRAIGAPGGGTFTIARDTSQHKFGTAAVQVNVNGVNPDGGLEYDYVSLTAGQTYTVSAWLKGPAGKRLRVYANDAPTLGVVTLTGSWQRQTNTFTATTTGTHAVWVTTDDVPTSPGYTFWVDGVQVEQRPIATPYIETNGATATRGNAYVRAPSSLLSTAGCWVAIRWRAGADSSQLDNLYGSTFPIFFWGDTGANYYGILYNGSGWMAEMNSPYPSAVQATSFSAGTTMTVIAYFSPTSEKISVNGAPFASTTKAIQPDFSTVSTFDIGGGSPIGRFGSGDVIWFAAGTGTLSNADVATISSWGNNDPTQSSFPASAQATMVWNGVGSTGSLK